MAPQSGGRLNPFGGTDDMPLIDIDLSPAADRMPSDVRSYLDAMAPRVEQFHSPAPGGFRGFVPCDYAGFYAALSQVRTRQLACGNVFCEWGSGLGIATCLAQQLGYRAAGIEIDEPLVEAAERFAAEFALEVDFVLGSFLPRGVDDLVDEAYADNDGCLSLIAHAGDAYEELGRDVRDFDVIFAFPWPNDEALTAQVFLRCASEGALLLTYDETDHYRLRRKTGGG